MPGKEEYSPSTQKNVKSISYLKTTSLFIFCLVIIVLSYLIFNFGIDRLRYYSKQQQMSALKEKVSLALDAINPTLQEFRAHRISRQEALSRIREIGHSLK